MIKHLLLAISLQLTPLVYHPAQDRPQVRHASIHGSQVASGGGGALVFNTATNSALIAVIGGF